MIAKLGMNDSGQVDEDRIRFMSTVPFYVNGTLDDSDHSWMTDYLQRNPGMEKMVQWHEQLQQEIQAKQAEQLERIPADVGWKKLSEKLAAERVYKGSTSSKGASRLKMRWNAWCQSLSAARWLPPAFAALAILVVSQSVVLGVLVSHDEDGVLVRSVEGIVGKDSVAYLQVSFKENASERSLRLALVNAGANIVDGPGQLGDYVLAVKKDHVDAAQKTLEESDLTESITRIEQMPVRAHEKKTGQ